MCYLRRHTLRSQLTSSKEALEVVDWKRRGRVLREFYNLEVKGTLLKV